MEQGEARVENLVGQEDVITDTVPARIFTAVESYYARHGYRLQCFTLVLAATYEATFTREERSS